jgi:3-oxoacyl-[acyl-carrier-protein] synthase II
MQLSRNNKKRVVITGLGPVSPVGIGKDEFWDSLIHGRSGITEITGFDASRYPTRIAGEVKNFNPTNFMSRSASKHAGRFSHLAVASARLAFDDSKLASREIDRTRIGASFGTSGFGSGDLWEQEYDKYLRKGLTHMSPFANSEYTPHIATGHVCIELGIKGVNTTISSGCSTFLDAVAWGYGQIIKGSADIVIAGATDATLFPFSFANLCAVGILSKRNEEPEKASRPYDRDSDGIVVSEGAAAVVLEDYRLALERRAPIFAEIIAYSSTAEAQNTLEVAL